MPDIREIAEAFATSLDEDNFTAAAALLAPQCTYHFRESILCGPEAIMAPYRENSEKAQRLLDEVRYSSEVRVQSPTEAVILFEDNLRQGNSFHSFRCQQRVQCEEGKILRILHEEIPGERDRLKTFFDEQGVPWA